MPETPKVPTPSPLPPGAQKINFPTVGLDVVEGFLKVYNQGGLVLLFDGVARKAMMDFANTVLRSFVMSKIQESLANAAKRGPSAPAPNTPPPTGVQTASKIILTDK
jgi:hypothetical protein